MPELIPEGKRVDTIVRLIASLRTKGLDDDAIKAAVRVENEKRCNPPLKEKELEEAVFPALKRDWQVHSPYYNKFNAMNENDNKYVNEVLKKLNELNAVERFPMNDRGSADLFATVFMDVSRYTGNRRWGYYNMSLPRVSTIPYLAKGAVIPPRSEFLAVLGDQKNGRNLEAPEGVIKDIIDDAFARHQQNSTGNVRFTAQINRRTVFDEIIEEAKLRQSTSGRNPFELA